MGKTMIECMKYKSVNKGSLLGYADLYLPKVGIEIYGCSLHQKDGRRWVNLPSKEYTDGNGEKKYAPIVKFPNKFHMDEFAKQAKEAIEKKCAEPRAQAMDFLEEETPF